MLTRIRIGFTQHSASNQRAWLPLLKITTAVLILIGAIHWAQRSTAGGATQTEGAVVTGVVQDDKGAPVVDAKVTLQSAELPVSVRTQADGKYEFRNLKPGQYRITADATSFRKQSITVTITRPDEAFYAPILRLGASSLHVAVLDGNNQPLRGVSVGLSTQERGSGATSIARATTDDGGDAYFGKLSPGSYQLAAVLRGYDE